MADPETIEEAVRILEKKGVTDVIVIPLFISSHSPIIGNSRYILGLQKELPATTDIKSLPRLESNIRFHMTGALDNSILVADILLERAKELCSDPSAETVIIVGHGPNNENENRLWLKDMEKLALYVREKGCFKEVKVATWRSDAPKEIRDKATQELRMMVQMSSKGGRVIVIPHLLSSGGVEGEIVDALKGLTYIYSGKTLLPHSNITKWIEMQVEKQRADFGVKEG
jgi:sirohydrochlorin ferrochelatase